MPEQQDRCRLVLIAPDGLDADAFADALSDALRGGDVATLILPQYALGDHAFQSLAERIVPIAHKADVAVLVHGDSRIAGRAKADGLHVENPAHEAAEIVEKFTPKMIVGLGAIKDRHIALEKGELRPDYVFFGRLDGDIKPEAHPKVLELAEWWASMVEIPCIAMGGLDPASALSVAETGAEFVAMRGAVFANPAGPAQAVAEINALIAEKAPSF